MFFGKRLCHSLFNLKRAYILLAISTLRFI